jgi:hypothetical protein
VPGGRQFLFDGRRVAVSTVNPALGIQLFESDGVDLSRWRPVLVVPGTKELAALEDGCLVLRSPATPTSPLDVFHVHEIDAGGPGAWGETAALIVNDAEGPRPLGPAVLTSGLLWIGDALAAPAAAARPGRIHLFAQDPATSSWAAHGAFAAPLPVAGDGFGGRLAVAGQSVLIATPSNYGNPTVWMGQLPGATATLLDDDAPTVHVSAASEFEPREAAAAIHGWLWLSHPSTEAITVNWRTVGGTAQAGVDFSPVDQFTVIEPGILAVPIEVPLLTDHTLEADSSFRVEITGVAGGATGVGNAADWLIRDTDPIPVVFAPQSEVYEGLETIKPAVVVHPAAEPVSVPWSIRQTAYPPQGPPHGVTGFAQAGSDFPPATGVITAATTGSHPLAVSATRDGVTEPAELATLALDLEPGMAAASYGTRQVASLSILPGNPTYSQHITTDGDRVALLTRQTDGGGSSFKAVVLYIRDPASPGGWRFDRSLRLADFGIPDTAAEDFLKLRRGRLAYYFPPTGRVWVLTTEGMADGSWKLEATFASRYGVESGFTSHADFDGEVFVTSRASGVHGYQVYIHERGSGDWGFHQDLQVYDPVGPVRVEGGAIVASLTVFGTSLPFRVLVLERAGFGADPWVRRDIVVPRELGLITANPRVHRDVIACSLPEFSFAYPSTTLYRRQDHGEWTAEQQVSTVVRAMDRGVLLGWNNPPPNNAAADHSWADVGTGTTRWQRMPQPNESSLPAFADPNRSVLDYHSRVLVGNVTFPPGAPALQGHFIAEPGADIRLIDSESMVVTASQQTFGWGNDREARATVRLSSTPLTTPIDLTIPFRTTNGGTATAGVDFRPVEGTAILRAGSWETSFVVPMLPDSRFEPMETVEIELGQPNFGVVQPSRLQLEIYPNVPRAAVRLPVAPVIFEPLAGTETHIVPFQLATAFSTSLSVGYTLSPGAATAADVTLGTGTIVVPPGRTAIPLPLTVLADSLAEGPETVRVTFTAFDSVALVGRDYQFDLTIDDRPTPGGTADQFTTTADAMLDFSPERSVRTNDHPAIGLIQAARLPLWGSVEWRPDGTFRYTPAPGFIGTDRFAYQGTVTGTTLLTESSSWRWLHPLNGQDPETTTPGFQANWTKPSFDDAAWSTGTGLMGYGVLGAGAGEPITTNIGTPASNRFTAYFRTTFTGPASPTTGLTLRFACDDAAIFYLNGTELGRYAKPPDPAFLAAANTYHLLNTNFHDREEETEVRTLSFPFAPLLPGTNHLAVSIHNQVPNSSDLGFKLVEATTGFTTHPILVEVQVSDAHRPPRVVDDSRTAPATTTPLDSHFLPPGSVYANDGLLAADGTPFDPILEAEIGGSPVSPVTFDKDTGQFRLTAPPGFFGTTAFTYRIRDKDGWSPTATVTLMVQPSDTYDVWRQAAFGGGSSAPLSAPADNPDHDTLNNLMEFTFDTNPLQPGSESLLTLDRHNGTWIAEFNTFRDFGEKAFVGLEYSTSLDATEWTRLAWINNAYPFLGSLAPGVSHAFGPLDSRRHRNTVTLPFGLPNHGYFRLRVSLESHVMNPY